MDTPTVALLVACLSLVSTLTFALLNYRYTKRTNTRAAAAELRAAATDARSTERSRVAWMATLSDDQYVMLENESGDTAKDVRVEYSLMIPSDPSEPATPAFYARSQDPRNAGEYSVVLKQSAVKDSIGPHKVVGLPIPESFRLGSAFTGGRRFGLNLHIEWFTDKGTPKAETLFVADLGVMSSGYLMPLVSSLPSGVLSDWEAVTPLKEPKDFEREYHDAERRAISGV